MYLLENFGTPTCLKMHRTPTAANPDCTTCWTSVLNQHTWMDMARSHSGASNTSVAKNCFHNNRSIPAETLLPCHSDGTSDSHRNIHCLLLQLTMICKTTDSYLHPTLRVLATAEHNVPQQSGRAGAEAPGTNTRTACSTPTNITPCTLAYSSLCFIGCCRPCGGTAEE